MADRILTWHIDRMVADSESQGPIYYMERDYFAGACRLYARNAPNGGDLKVDIRDDGVSIFTSNYAALNKGGNLEEHAEDYPANQSPIEEGSILSLHIIEANGAGDITCHLELETLSDEDESE